MEEVNIDTLLCIMIMYQSILGHYYYLVLRFASYLNFIFEKWPVQNRVLHLVDISLSSFPLCSSVSDSLDVFEDGSPFILQNALQYGFVWCYFMIQIMRVCQGCCRCDPVFFPLHLLRWHAVLTYYWKSSLGSLGEGGTFCSPAELLTLPL